jgi:hypothetical protein
MIPQRFPYAMIPDGFPMPRFPYASNLAMIPQRFPYAMIPDSSPMP